MYKTVRKGDASLQYTIVPQTDQFSSEFPQTSEKSSPRVIKYTIATLLVLIILSCVATPFLISQNDQSLFAGTVLAMGRVGHDTMERNSSRSQGKEIGVNKSKSRVPITTTTTTTTTLPSSEAYRKQDVEDEMTTGALNAEEQESEEFTTTGMNSLCRFLPPSPRQTESMLVARLCQVEDFYYQRKRKNNFLYGRNFS